MNFYANDNKLCKLYFKSKLLEILYELNSDDIHKIPLFSKKEFHQFLQYYDYIPTYEIYNQVSLIGNYLMITDYEPYNYIKFPIMKYNNELNNIYQIPVDELIDKENKYDDKRDYRIILSTCIVYSDKINSALQQKYDCDNFEECGNFVQNFKKEDKYTGLSNLEQRIKLMHIITYKLCNDCHEIKEQEKRNLIVDIKNYELENVNRCLNTFDYQYEFYTNYIIYVPSMNYIWNKPICHYCYHYCLNAFNKVEFEFERSCMCKYNTNIVLCYYANIIKMINNIDENI